jgi:hypothetical protein
MSAKLEIICPDVSASTWQEFARLEGREILPQYIEVNQFGAEVLFEGRRFVGDQEAMEGYPKPGSYYLTETGRTVFEENNKTTYNPSKGETLPDLD